MRFGFLDISCYAENHVTTEKATSFPLETVVLREATAELHDRSEEK